jgi:hypothetical protein
MLLENHAVLRFLAQDRARGCTVQETGSASGESRMRRGDPMNYPAVALLLATKGLRFASLNESGWYYITTVDGVRRSFWVTDIKAP